MRTITSLLLLACASVSPATEVPVPAFTAGDSVCLIGDSITHGGGYHANLLLFYATRLPSARFSMHNCGIAGDSASGVLRRFDWDIAVHRPTVATIMLGMNDVGRHLYPTDSADRPDPALQRKAIDDYAANLEQLALRLDDLSCRIIVLTPSIYDQTGNQKTDNYVGVNDALATCAGLGRELADRHHGTVVDFHAPLTRINAEGQAADPSYTIVGADRVHPGAPGHLVMTYLMLKAQGLPGTVAGLSIDAASGKLTVERCTVSDLVRRDGAVSFTSLAESLPFPVPPGARSALTLVPLMAELNREPLSITSLPVGRYELLIDGHLVLEATADDLATGIDLAQNEATPQYRQSVEVRTINDHRHMLISQRLRTLVAVEHGIIRQAKHLNAGDQAAIDVLLGERLRKAKEDKFTYGVWQLETYQQWKPRQNELEAEIKNATEALWKACLPKPRHYLVRPKV